MTRERQVAASAKTGKLSIQKQCLVPRPERGVGQGTFCMPLAGGSLSVLGSTPFLFRGPVYGRSHAESIRKARERAAAIAARRPEVRGRRPDDGTFAPAVQDRGTHSPRKKG